MSSTSCHRKSINHFISGTLQKLDSNMVERDAAMDAMIAPYSITIDSLVNEVIGYSGEAMHVKKPESNLGNLLADFLLKYGRRFIKQDIDMALFNTGGFRIPIPPGAITLGHAMELMPFDNTMVIAQLNGAQMIELAQTIFQNGGDPIAGNDVLIQIVGTEVSLSLGGQMIEKDKEYTVLTSSYLIEGGDNYKIFTTAGKIYDSGVLVRDAIIYAYKVWTSFDHPAMAPVGSRIIMEPNR